MTGSCFANLFRHPHRPRRVAAYVSFRILGRCQIALIECHPLNRYEKYSKENAPFNVPYPRLATNSLELDLEHQLTRAGPSDFIERAKTW